MDEIINLVGKDNLLLLLILAIVATILIIGLRISASIQARKVQQAIISMQKDISEINERQKSKIVS